VTGETGTGKEVIARLIHTWSGRAGDFVAINCGALTETLIESELFGYRRGSFTGAVADHPGAVRQAANGTLFLDEIGELSKAGQAKLLRMVELGEVHPLGVPHPERVDVCIVAASNKNLKEEVSRGLFRKDLYYRLQSFNVHMPPLRERTDDIPALTHHFIEEAFSRHGECVTFTPEAIEAMKCMPLHGNARELRSIIESTILTAPKGASITRETVEIVGARKTYASFGDPWAGCVLRQEVLRYEADLIQMALEASGGRLTQAARLLGITHQTLADMLDHRHRGHFNRIKIPRRKTIMKSRA
jgi:two-component system response regulator HupR/HoxA